MTHIITSDKGGGKCFVRLSVCLLAKLFKKSVHGFGWNVAWRQMSGHERNDYLWAHTDNSPDARTGLLSLILYYVFATVARHGFKMVLRSTAANTRGFTMVLFTEPSKHLCRRYMHSNECHSSYHC